MKLKNTFLLIAVLIILLCFVSCKKSPVISPDDFIPVVFDETNVQTVRIGNQIWMAENLKVNVDPNGNRLNCQSINGNSDLDEVYGRIYTWDQAQAACPGGWHLPSMEEWQVMFDFLGGSEVAGGKMKTLDLWESPNVGATNSSGFSAVPSGPHDGFGWACHFWSSTEDGNIAYIPSLTNLREDVYVLYDQTKSNTISVRYIKN